MGVRGDASAAAEIRFHRRINVSDTWADDYQDRFASPVRVGAPISVPPSA